MRIAAFALALGLLGPACAVADEMADWQAQAARITIARDDWGIAHVKGKTDADAVFGMAYAQAEDDFNRVEMNYLTALGRVAEAEGEAAIWQDLRQRLYYDEAGLKADYAKSPPWMQALMDAWADGLNYYLATHPETKPKVLTRFEPWMALSFTEGSIGGDIERIALAGLEAFYGGASPPLVPAKAGTQIVGGGPGWTSAARIERALQPSHLDPGIRRDERDESVFREPSGSNGIAIGPQITRGGNALLLINPHTSFFFRSELQMTSEEGLNAYGAVTWGQFFVYQGFNDDAGWMHTSSGVDVVDEFAETVERTPGGLKYRYGGESRPLESREVTLRYRTPDGALASRTFTTYRTHHGPIVRAEGDRWIAFAMMHKPVEALQQSFLRTKAHDLQSFLEVAELKANSSNNTLFADTKGQTAYLHPQFIPRRDDRFDYTRPVDGADPASDWNGLHELAEAPRVINPHGGWVFNTNNWPYSAAGDESPRAANYPRYMDTFGETPRGRQAIRVLDSEGLWTLERLQAAAYDPYLTAFAELVPGLVAAHREAADTDPLKARLAEEIAALKAWDFRWGKESVETSLAVFWGEALWALAAPQAKAAGINTYRFMVENSTPAEKLAALAQASDRLTADFGTWRTPWGEINRFQRLTGDIVQDFDDSKPSIAVPFTSGQWGSLASFGARRYPGTKRYYGTSGNSFVAVVEFAPKVKAVAVSAGGESGDPESPHFNDQAQRYADGALRKVYFHPEDLAGHVERTYRPGE